MEKHKLNWITWGFTLLALLVIVFMLVDTLHRPPSITLPDTELAQDQTTEETDPGNGALSVVSVRPDTVQAAIATLSRSEYYRRSVTIEQFWGSGSGSYEVLVTVSGPWTRTDRTMPDGRVRHSITGSDTVYIWYNNEEEIFSAPVGTVSADHEQSVPTYEEILEMPPERITAADYRTISETNCIYVEATEGEDMIRYWVSVDTGLLVAAEKLLDGETVYRMGALSIDESEPAAEEFTLPDGTVLDLS